MTLSEFRAQFDHVRHLIYLDHAATGPLSRPVREAVTRFLAERSAAQPNNFEAVAPVLMRGRERLARLLRTTPGRIEYAPSTSHALNVVALGLDWRKGDRVAIPECEFPANVHPWRSARPKGVRVDMIPSPEGGVTVEAVERTLRPETRVLSVSWVQFLSGFRCDLSALSALCREHDVIFCVDAIQGLGALQLDVGAAGIDFLACGGQKWMLGMQGGAFFYVTEALQDRLTPMRGWLNGPVDWDDFGAFTDELHPDAERFRVGTPATAPLLGLEAALALAEAVGGDLIEKAVLSRARQLAAGLEELGFIRYGSPDAAHASGIVAVEAPDAEALRIHLAEEGVAVSVRDRKVRFAPHAYVTEAEIDRTLEAVEAFSACRTPSQHAP